MGLRFRRSIKILPGVKLNLGKKSAGVSVGTTGARYSVNSSGRKTSTVGIPGTGLSYSKSSGGGKKSDKGSKSVLPWRLILTVGILIFILIGGIAACTDSDDEPTTTTTAAETTTEAEPESKTSIIEAVAALSPHETTAEAAETTEKATEKLTEKLTESKNEKKTEKVAEKKTEKATEKKTAAPSAQKTYVLNKSTMKFHLPSCSSCSKIKAENKGSYTGSRDDLIGQGYSPCGNCHP